MSVLAALFATIINFFASLLFGMLGVVEHLSYNYSVLRLSTGIRCRLLECLDHS
ncbi:MAG: hypothetical protein QW429_05390 [Thermoprotei archaeon]